MQIGDIVRVLPPFDQAFYGDYIINGIDETGAFLIQGDRGFGKIYLELAESKQDAQEKIKMRYGVDGLIEVLPDEVK